MTIRTKTYLKSIFETGDVPLGVDFSDAFDSLNAELGTDINAALAAAASPSANTPYFTRQGAEFAQTGEYRDELKFVPTGALVEAPWSISVSSGGSSDHDNVLGLLYNVRYNQTTHGWERLVSGEHAIRQGYESRWVDAPGDPEAVRGNVEWNLDIDVSTTGAIDFSKRPFFMEYHMDGTPYAQFQFGDSDDAASNLNIFYGDVGIGATPSGTGAMLYTAPSLTKDIQFNAITKVRTIDAGTNNQPRVASFGHNTSGTPEQYFGSLTTWQLETTTTEDTDAFWIFTYWNDSPHSHATRKPVAEFRACDAAANATCVAIGADGSGNPLVGFFGAAPVAKPTGVAVSAAGIHAALVTLGLIAS